MELNEIYNQDKKPDNIDLLELLEEIKKDKENFKLLPLKNVIVQNLFNPLLKEYYAIKETFLKAQEKNPESFSTKDFNLLVSNLVKKQPDYQKYIKYVGLDKLEEREKQEVLESETEEEEEL